MDDHDAEATIVALKEQLAALQAECAALRAECAALRDELREGHGTRDQVVLASTSGRGGIRSKT